MSNNESQEAKNYIDKLRAMGFEYHFAKYTTKQLKMIYLRSMEARKKICKEIADLGQKVGKRYNLTNLYNSSLNIDNLRGLKSRLEKEYHRLLVVNEIMEYANILGKDTNFILQNMFLGPKTTADLEDVLDKLKYEIYQLEMESKAKPQEDIIHYDASYAMGDDPILDQVEINIVLPKEKVKEIIDILDSLKRRRKNKSALLDRISKKDYDRLMAKYHDLDKNYPKLDSLDFEWLINIYNQAIESLEDEFEDINENEYTKHI